MAGELSPEVIAAIQEAIAAGMASAQPLAPPPTITPLTVQATPKLGLKMPQYVDAADILVLNDNMVTLDNAITADVAATLTNKTLTAPIINNPTINGWTNAQHTHLDAASAGPLDGAAIVTGTKGTGLLLRESGASGVVLTDPVVRDALYFGEQGTALPPDVTLSRTGAGALRVDTNLGVGVNPEAMLAGYPTVRIGRDGGFYAGSSNAQVILAQNGIFNGAGSAVAVFAGAASRVQLNAGSLNLDTAPSVAAGATQTWTTRAQIAPTGTLTLTPDANQPAINAVESVRVQGNNVQIGPAGNNPSQGGRVIYNDDAGALHWSTGLLAVPGARDFVIYDFVRNVQVFTIAATTGAVTCIPISQGESALTAQGNIIATAENTGVPVRIGSAYSRAGVYSGGYMDVTAEGVVTVKSIAGGVLLLAGSGASVQTQCASIYMHPTSDSQHYIGHPSYRYSGLYVVNAPVVGSSLDLKQDIAPLDPASCAQAVLETDWVEFSYLPPMPPGFEPPPSIAYDERDNNEVKAEKKVARDEAEADAKAAYTKMLVETASGRRQKGYVLQSPDHQVHDLFGLPDRASRSDGADLAVVACALQNALQRIEALEVQVAGAA